VCNRDSADRHRLDVLSVRLVPPIRTTMLPALHKTVETL
jgi:hypothetical protein